uniref:Uncharacterized protein n=1 Tax=Anguilla anguilla TaxID=7936 RepID=A0A0E9PNG9_ANGAN
MPMFMMIMNMVMRTNACS